MARRFAGARFAVVAFAVVRLALRRRVARLRAGAGGVAAAPPLLSVTAVTDAGGVGM
ncbi:MAG: hypothetical protein JOY80_01640 [Candidatus Dormibacteraeota bacterium]|nr:hypothetical protein [Candidatus Dormibacteraeota bacterium]